MEDASGPRALDMARMVGGCLDDPDIVPFLKIMVDKNLLTSFRECAYIGEMMQQPF